MMEIYDVCEKLDELNTREQERRLIDKDEFISHIVDKNISERTDENG